MNTFKLRVLAVFSLIAIAGPASLMAQAPYFNIPFGFNVGQKALAPGAYLVREVSPNVLEIRNANNHAAAMILTHGDEPGKVAGKATLTFQRYGDQYFLSRVSTDARGWGLVPSAREKELIAKRAEPRKLDILASSGK